MSAETRELLTSNATPMAPTYSIIIPTYRRREPLARCLAAINALDYPRDKFELVIVDDGSPSPPNDLLTVLDSDVSVRLVSKDHAGPAAARNHGASLACGTYLAFTDDDCAPRPDWLREMDGAVRSAGDGAAIGGRTVNILTDDIFAAASQGMVDYLYEYYGSEHRPGQFFTSNNLVVPRRDFLELGGFDVRFKRAAAEDRDLCERWSRSGRPLVHAPNAVVDHAHAMGFARFNRTHFNYGRGAFDLHRSRARRGERTLKMEPLRFYRGLVMHPLRTSRGGRAVVLALLYTWSQVAYAAGYFFERVKRGWTVEEPT